ncbi:MAG: M48 family metalloprotease, partial [Bacteroidetes bacterium]|nr:M48 family metalloprotease [Bacteroidota bacterium]
MTLRVILGGMFAFLSTHAQNPYIEFDFNKTDVTPHVKYQVSSIYDQLPRGKTVKLALLTKREHKKLDKKEIEGVLAHELGHVA